jgi:sugar/nucleoside kinase (ribokinase family)
MKKYDIFGIGTTLLDTKIIVTDDFLAELGVSTGLMTLADEERQDHLIKAPHEQTTHVKKAHGGSACNSIVATISFGADTFYAGKVDSDEGGGFCVKDLTAQHCEFYRLVMP